MIKVPDNVLEASKVVLDYLTSEAQRTQLIADYYEDDTSDYWEEEEEAFKEADIAQRRLEEFTSTYKVLSEGK